MNQSSALPVELWTRDLQRVSSRPDFKVVEIPEESVSQDSHYPEELTLQLKYVSDLRPKRLASVTPFRPVPGGTLSGQIAESERESSETTIQAPFVTETSDRNLYSEAA